jgi:hypothetical protein
VTELIFGILLQGLKIWNSKESTKYHDRVLELRKSWLEEYSKPRGQRSNSDLDEIESELYLIGKMFSEINTEKKK